MFYNLEAFGNRLKEIRKSLKISQNYISCITGIDEKTIRRIENGKVLPKLDTLDILSPYYKEDLVSLLLEYRFDDYSAFSKISNKIENKIDNEEHHTLHEELKELNLLLSKTENPYCRNLIDQLIYFAEAATIYKYNKDVNLALSKFINAIKYTIPYFSLDNYTDFVYSSTEIRILMNIAFIMNKLNNKNKYIEILEFCIESVDTDDELYPKLCHNLASAYIRIKEYSKALTFSNLGIEASQNNRNYKGLNILYYGKGLAEYYLGKVEYINSLKLSISLCEAFGQVNLKENIIASCKKIIGINLGD